MAEEFDYGKAMEQLESIAAKVEDPRTSLKEVEECVRRSREIIRCCRDYLRGVKESIDNE